MRVGKRVEGRRSGGEGGTRGIVFVCTHTCVCTCVCVCVPAPVGA